MNKRPGCYQFPPAPDSTRLSFGGASEPSTSRGRQDKVHVILDEAPWFLDAFVKRLEAELGKDGVLVIWAASSFPSWRPKSFKEVVLTQSLRCPPVVVREMMKSPCLHHVCPPRLHVPGHRCAVRHALPDRWPRGEENPP